ncbi:MAG: hypothetical protein II073_05210 [Lachnospiraceae bacterium]|nr:hypothetical protein [Lachnospiraceae bacterium]
MDDIKKYKLVDMFDKLDPALLEDLQLDKDLKRKQRWIRRLFRNGHVRIASIIASVCLLLTGTLVLIIRVRKLYRRRTV